jgi:hypothetical protein
MYGFGVILTVVANNRKIIVCFTYFYSMVTAMKAQVQDKS